MPIAVSDLISAEIGNIKFLFGGTPADVTEYPDGGRMAAVSPISVSALSAVTDRWSTVPTSTVPAANAIGMVPEFYGPAGILALRVDYGYGPVVLRADAAHLHKTLRDILITKLSQLKVDEENYTAQLTAQVAGINAKVDGAVAAALAQVDVLIRQQQGSVITDVVKEQLPIQAGPLMSAAIDDAMTNRVPPLVDAKVTPAVATAVGSATADLGDQIASLKSRATSLETSTGTLTADLGSARRDITSLNSRTATLEALTKIRTWSKTAKTADCTVEFSAVRLMQFVVVSINLTALKSGKGQTGFAIRPIGLPSDLLPRTSLTVACSAINPDGTLIDPDNFRMGISAAGDVTSQGYWPWDQMTATFAYTT
ncbi:hypothetical protein [Actinomadura oligospora]|uniref:hypothetical protein n=1 Tax=Actinomadura oligospora TaxID=111804 RepID=UPI00047B3C51|nr:hypothetical protein [Actinomadura oligospora]